MRKLAIAIGNSRYAKKWVNRETGWEKLCERFKVPKRTIETVAEYPKLSKAKCDEIKDVGGFVTGHLHGGKRKIDTVACLSMLKLDADEAEKYFIVKFAAIHRYESFVYSTHSHMPDAPRYAVSIRNNFAWSSGNGQFHIISPF